MNKEEFLDKILSIYGEIYGEDFVENGENSYKIANNLNDGRGFRKEIRRCESLLLSEVPQNSPSYDKLLALKEELEGMIRQLRADRIHKWQENNPDKVRLSKMKWKAKNPEKQREYAKKYASTHPEKIRALAKKYYTKNKAKVHEANRNWRQDNKKTFAAIVNRRRKEVAMELKERGVMFTFKAKTERTNLNLNYIQKKLGVDREDAIKLWDYFDNNTKYITSHPLESRDYLNSIEK